LQVDQPIVGAYPATAATAAKPTEAPRAGGWSAEERGTQVADWRPKIYVIQNILKIYWDRDVVTLGGLVAAKATGPTTTAAAAGPTTAAAAAGAATTTTGAAHAAKTTARSAAASAITLALRLGRRAPFASETKRPTNAEVRDQRAGPLAIVTRNDHFSTGRIRIEGAKFGNYNSGLWQIARKRRSLRKQSVAIQVAANSDVEWATRWHDDHGIETDVPRRSESPK